MKHQKNILFILTDQHRFDHVGWHPESKIDTPNLNRLSEGTVFLDCNTVNPLCTPARCALLTGRYAHQVNMRTMSGELDPAYKTVPQALKEAGYRTSLIGKTHWWQAWSWFDTRMESHYDMRGLNQKLRCYGYDKVWEAGEKRAIGPNRNDYTTFLEEKGYGQSYRNFYEKITGATFRIQDTILEKFAPLPFPEDDQAEVVLTSKIIEEIDRASKENSPFCINAHYFAPHDPLDPPQRLLNKVSYEEDDDFVTRQGQPPLDSNQKKDLWKLRQAYKASILLLDEQIGRLFKALDERKLLQDTVIIFTADHGELMGDHGYTQKGLPWKQSVQVPTAIYHPDFINKITCDAPVEIIDLCATILEIAGLDPISALSERWPSYQDMIPCRSLMPIIRGEVSSVRDYAFSECDMKWHDEQGYEQWSWQMIVTKNWKYIRYLDRKAKTPEKSRSEVLIKRNEDPSEISNVVHDMAEQSTLERLRMHLDFINDTTPTAQTCWIPFELRSKNQSKADTNE